MINKKIILFVGLIYFGVVLSVFCQDTNVVFLPEDIYDDSGSDIGVIFYGKKPAPGKMDSRYKQIMDAAIKAGECRPAEQDPEGHWGEVVGGFQLSIRSATNVFVIGKPIPITVIFRNTETNNRPYIYIPQNLIKVVQDDFGQDIPERSMEKSFFFGGSSKMARITAQHQIKGQCDLQECLASVKTGIYSVYVKQPVMFYSEKPIEIPSTNGIPIILPVMGPITNISSGVLTIKLIEPLQNEVK